MSAHLFEWAFFLLFIFLYEYLYIYLSYTITKLNIMNTKEDLKKNALDSIELLMADILSDKKEIIEINANRDIGFDIHGVFGYLGTGDITFKFND